MAWHSHMRTETAGSSASRPRPAISRGSQACPSAQIRRSGMPETGPRNGGCHRPRPHQLRRDRGPRESGCAAFDKGGARSLSTRMVQDYGGEHLAGQTSQTASRLRRWRRRRPLLRRHRVVAGATSRASLTDRDVPSAVFLPAVESGHNTGLTGGGRHGLTLGDLRVSYTSAFTPMKYRSPCRSNAPSAEADRRSGDRRPGRRLPHGGRRCRLNLIQGLRRATSRQEPPRHQFTPPWASTPPPARNSSPCAPPDETPAKKAAANDRPRPSSRAFARTSGSARSSLRRNDTNLAFYPQHV